MKKILFLLLFSFVFNFIAAQDDTIDTHLNNINIRDFPDSVRNTQLISLKKKTTTISKVLAAHKGQKIFIDIWATWCRDCIVGLPKYNELRRNLADKNIAYIFISVNKKNETWKKGVDRFSIDAEHYKFIDGWSNSFNDFIRLDYIPRYIIIDENGTVIHTESNYIDDIEIFKKLKK